MVVQKFIQAAFITVVHSVHHYCPNMT